jgi:hypothetical protein
MESFRKPLLSVDPNILCCRYVPKPKPGVFRITKTVHNILQGVAKPDVRISIEEKQVLTDWIADNAKRYWLSPGGPLRPVEEGGADVIMVSLREKNAKRLC